MKKLLLAILIGQLIIAPFSWAVTSWYACSAAGNMSAMTWKDDPTCAAGNTLSWNSQVAGDIFYANAITPIVVDFNPQGTGGSAGKVRITTAAGAGAAGGSFSYATASVLHMDMDITAGTTTCLNAAGSQAGDAGTIHGNILGGGTAAADAVNTTHTVGTLSIIGTVTGGSQTTTYGVHGVSGTGQIAITGTVTSGSNATAYGLYVEGGPDAVITGGNCVGATTYGCYTHSALSTITLTGDCVTEGSIAGCVTAKDYGLFTVNGNFITLNYDGNLLWNPGTLYTDYRYIMRWGGGTTYYYTSIPPLADKVNNGTTYGWQQDGSTYYTGTLSSGGGGGAWGF